MTALHLRRRPATCRPPTPSHEKQSFDWATTACAVRLAMDGGEIAAATSLGAVALLMRGRDPDTGRQEAAEAVPTRRRAAPDAAPLAHNAFKLPIGRPWCAQPLRATR